MRRRLDLAMTLVGDPRIIFLDEPTGGLDPRSRRVMWQIVRDLVAGGVTIFLTTQYLEEADRLASRIAVLDGGRIVAEGTPDELKRLVPGGRAAFTDGELSGRPAFDGARMTGADPAGPERRRVRFGPLDRPTPPRSTSAGCGRPRHRRRLPVPTSPEHAGSPTTPSDLLADSATMPGATSCALSMFCSSRASRSC
jgi:hypothetical protein